MRDASPPQNLSDGDGGDQSNDWKERTHLRDGGQRRLKSDGQNAAIERADRQIFVTLDVVDIDKAQVRGTGVNTSDLVTGVAQSTRAPDHEAVAVVDVADLNFTVGEPLRKQRANVDLDE